MNRPVPSCRTLRRFCAMLRLNEIKLPLDHDAAALPAAIVERLGIDAGDLLGFSVFKRSYDARKKAHILLIYQLDVELPAGLEQTVAGTSRCTIRVWDPVPTPITALSPTPLRIFRQPGSSGRLWSDSGPVASWPRCCWRKWASDR